MLGRTSILLGALGLAQAVSMSGTPVQGAQNCGPGAHWVQTGAGLGSGYCKKNHKHRHKHDHYVCVIGYHYAGNGRCVRNGTWWTGRRPYQWGPYYEPRNKFGSVVFEGPNGGKVKVRW